MTENISNHLAAAIDAMPGAVPKDSRNKHAGYDYASADSIYLSVRNHLAKSGLSVWQDEESVEVVGKVSKEEVAWVRATYKMALIKGATATQSEMDGAEKVTVMTPVRNAQAFAAIRTYALKYWIRGKCLLAIGDVEEDIDQEPNNPIKAVEKGEWTLDPETFVLNQVGSWTNPQDRQAAFYIKMNALLAKKLDSETALMAWETNEQLARSVLTGPAEKGLVELEKAADYHSNMLDKIMENKDEGN